MMAMADVLYVCACVVTWWKRMFSLKGVRECCDTVGKLAVVQL